MDAGGPRDDTALGIWTHPRSVLLLACTFFAVSTPLARPETAVTNHLSAANGISLTDGIRETLEHDPYIQLQERQVQVAKGALGVASGQFDPALATALSQGVTRFPRSKTD